MRSTITAVLMVTALLLVPLAAAHAGGGPTEPVVNQPDENASPGARLAAVVGAENATITGDFEENTFTAKFRNAASPGAKAAVVAAEVGTIERRIEVLRDRQEDLVAAHKNGTIPENAYRAKATRLAAQIRSLEQLANATEKRARAVPAEALAAHGVDLAAVQALANNAQNLTGPEVAEIARSFGPGPASPPGQSEDVSEERATAAIEQATNRLQRLNATYQERKDGLSQSDRQTVASRLEKSRSALDDARTAVANDNPARGLELANDALGHLRVASTALTGTGNGAGGPGAGDQTTPNGSTSGPPDDTPSGR